MHKNTYTGKFIVFEGLDGSGQSTQAELLKDYLEKSDKQVLLTKEPTLDSDAGREIAEVLSHKKTLSSDKLQELFVEDRRDHLNKLILPVLKDGVFVISDRYFLSTLAFGSIDCNLELLIKLNNDFMEPDITFILEVRPEISIGRIEKRGKEIQLFEKLDKLTKVAENYRILSQRFENIFVVDGEKLILEVHGAILEKLNNLLV
jgi:dTMP kinase